MKEIKALIRASQKSDVLHALHQNPNLPGVTVSDITGFGRVVGRDTQAGPRFDSVKMCKLECIIPDSLVAEVVGIIQQAAHTGHPGDGKIAIIPIDELVRIRTNERIAESL